MPNKDNKPQTKSVWTWLKDGKPQGYFKDENSLLVSYDMMPLCGLDVTKIILNEKGHIAKGHLVITQDTDIFVPYRYDSPDIEAMDWGCVETDYGRCFYSLAYYVYNNETIHISKEDNDVLLKYHLLKYECDGRRRRPFEKVKTKAEDILKGVGYSICSVTFVPGVK